MAALLPTALDQHFLLFFVIELMISDIPRQHLARILTE